MEKKDPKDITLSVIVPVYNEAATVEKVIEKIEGVSLNTQIILINDGSSDGSKQILEKYKDKYTVFHMPYNRGKGACIRKGLEFVKGDIVIIQDADLEYTDYNYYNKFTDPIISGQTKVVFGSRFLEKSNKHPFWNGLANRFLSLLTSILYFRRITDMETCYKVFHSSLIPKLKLKADRFDIEPELTSQFMKLKEKIIEVPTPYKPRTKAEGKKIGVKDGFEAIFALLKHRFFY